MKTARKTGHRGESFWQLIELYLKISRTWKIKTLFTQVSRTIAQLEDKIRSNHRIGSLKFRTTGKTVQLIWRRVDFIEFDRQWWHQPDRGFAEKKFELTFNTLLPISKRKSISSEGKGFLYCVYKYTNEDNNKKLTLMKKKPLLDISGYSKSKTIKALNILSNTLSCSNELKKISRILELYWWPDLIEAFSGFAHTSNILSTSHVLHL